MRSIGRVEAAMAARLAGLMVTARRMTRSSADAIHLLATGLLSAGSTEPTVSARCSHARITDGATR
jgi:hypothetical protein